MRSVTPRADNASRGATRSLRGRRFRFIVAQNADVALGAVYSPLAGQQLSIMRVRSARNRGIERVKVGGNFRQCRPVNLDRAFPATLMPRARRKQTVCVVPCWWLPGCHQMTAPARENAHVVASCAVRQRRAFDRAPGQRTRSGGLGRDCVAAATLRTRERQNSHRVTAGINWVQFRSARNAQDGYPGAGQVNLPSARLR